MAPKSPFNALYCLSNSLNQQYTPIQLIESIFKHTSDISDSYLPTHMINFILYDYIENNSLMITNAKDIITLIKIIIDINIHKRQLNDNLIEDSPILFYSIIETCIQQILKMELQQYDSISILDYLLDIAFIKQSLINEYTKVSKAKNNCITLFDQLTTLLQHLLKKNESSLYSYSIYPSQNKDNIVVPYNNNHNSNSNQNPYNIKEEETINQVLTQLIEEIIINDNQPIIPHPSSSSSTSSLNPSPESFNNLDYNLSLHYHKDLGSSLNYPQLQKEIKSQFPNHEVYIIGAMRYGILDPFLPPIIDILILPGKKQKKLLTSYKDYHYRLSQIPKHNPSISLSFISFSPRPGYIEYAYTPNCKSNIPNIYKDFTLHIYLYNKIYRQTSKLQVKLYSYSKIKQLYYYARGVLVKEMKIVNSSYDLSLLIMHFLDYEYKAFIEEESEDKAFSYLSYCDEANAFESKVRKSIKGILYRELNGDVLMKLDRDKEKSIEQLCNEFVNYAFDYMGYINSMANEGRCSDKQRNKFEGDLINDNYLLNRVHIDMKVKENMILEKAE